MPPDRSAELLEANKKLLRIRNSQGITVSNNIPPGYLESISPNENPLLPKADKESVEKAIEYLKNKGLL